MSSLDYNTFADPLFDANEYANAVLAGEKYRPSQSKRTSKSASTTNEGAKEDISVALAKLSFGIEDVSKQLKTVVNVHHEALLNQAASIQKLQGSLHSVKGGLGDIGGSVEKLRQKIRVPYQNLAGHVVRLQRLQVASDVLRRTARFVLLARRLEVQMTEVNKASVDGPITVARSHSAQVANGVTAPKPGTPINEDGQVFGPEGDKERSIIKAALSIAEIYALVEAPTERTSDDISNSNSEMELEDAVPNISLRSIHAVITHLPAVETARARVTAEMESMVVQGLQDLNQSLLASSLQTAFNLRILPTVVESLVSDLTDVVKTRIRQAFDMARLAKDANTKEPVNSSGLMYKSRVRTEPTNVTISQWTTALWARLEALMGDLSQCCIKVYTLERVLKLKKDPTSQVVFLDEAMKVMESIPSASFWTTLAMALERQCKDAAKSSTFLQQTLTTGYPRFLRLFHEFFAKIAVHTDTVFTQTQQSPETVLALRAVSNFEALYLLRSINRMNEAVGSALAGGARTPPTVADGVNIARVITNELDSARFDPLLVRAVAKNATSCLELLVTRVDALVVRDRSATTLLGPQATVQQYLNAQLVTSVYHCWLRLSKLEEEFPESVMNIVSPAVKGLQATYLRIVDPLLNTIRLEISTIIARLHRIDFGGEMDTQPGIGGPTSSMKDLTDKLAFLRVEILSKYNVGELGQTWAIGIVCHALKSFVLHVSIIKPLGESGKLQLTTDMTELEFALNSFLLESSGASNRQRMKIDAVGDDYKALRALRPLLFIDNASLALPDRTAGLSPLIVLHHILVRSPLPLPHKLHGWHESQYVRFVEEHSEEEVWDVIDQGLTHWKSTHDGEESVDMGEADEYIVLARQVLANARAGSG